MTLTWSNGLGSRYCQQQLEQCTAGHADTVNRPSLITRGVTGRRRAARLVTTGMWHRYLQELCPLCILSKFWPSTELCAAQQFR